MQESHLKVVEIKGKQYSLHPNAYQGIEQLFEQEYQYEQLAKQAKNSFVRHQECISSQLNSDHKSIVRNHLPRELCSSLIEEFKADPRGIQDPSVLSVLLPEVFTDELDRLLISYFQSEYHVFWWSIYEVTSGMEAEDDGYFAKWHCDGGPKEHLKVIVYLNDYEEHKSDTGFLGKDETDTLKDIGYMFTKLDTREANISDLCAHYGIKFEPEFFQPKAGDCMIFNPYQLGHRAFSPQPGKTRYALNFCLVPSAVGWRETIEKYYVAEYDCQRFKGHAQKAMKFTSDRAEQIVEKETITIALDHEISNKAHLEYLLANIFSNIQVAQALYQYFLTTDPYLIQCQSIFDFVRICKTHIHQQLDISKLLDPVLLEALTDLSRYEMTFKDSFARYSLDNKPDPNAIFWPDPSHVKHPRSKFDMLPFVQSHPIMDSTTAIGSAGSCFAFEIAKYLQKSGFNYVITERNDDPSSGVHIDGYQPGDQYAKFCANYGILFNTPSFLQLAEKAFGLRHFSQLLIDSENGYLLDPYREGVAFDSEQAYLNDYNQHITAVRNSFLQAEVFILTLGLNECWQLHDGTVMSRNPRPNMYHLVKHKTLSVQENIDNVQRFFDIIKAQNPNFKLILSVSPIPFLATGRAEQHHIISANCHSKSVLRVAAEELVNNNPEIYYLPSYEYITECCKDAWDVDDRHVRPEAVAQVVDMFQRIFVK